MVNSLEAGWSDGQVVGIDETCPDCQAQIEAWQEALRARWGGEAEVTVPDWAPSAVRLYLTRAERAWEARVKEAQEAAKALHPEPALGDQCLVRGEPGALDKPAVLLEFVEEDDGGFLTEASCYWRVWRPVASPDFEVALAWRGRGC